MASIHQMHARLPRGQTLGAAGFGDVGGVRVVWSRGLPSFIYVSPGEGARPAPRPSATAACVTCRVVCSAILPRVVGVHCVCVILDSTFEGEA